MGVHLKTGSMAAEPVTPGALVYVPGILLYPATPYKVIWSGKRIVQGGLGAVAFLEVLIYYWQKAGSKYSHEWFLGVLTTRLARPSPEVTASGSCEER